MERTLDAASFRQKVMSNNVANVDTPYFKRSDVQFEELLEKELIKNSLQGRRTDPRHIPIGVPAAPVAPKVVTDETTLMNNNLNNVDIDYEMALLAKNQLRYNVIVGQVNSDLKHYRTALNGGR
ncbi:MAG: flagellar basal-body rod protein FlgB [Paenibacillus sp.]|jgi:flagellar basal-body rod protein FlgB|nr:flagellar basal body rod protein FlgB [Paenibacillus oceani]MDF2658329.1 flagellar basal-body rod protein FlgB [Paenibacillus sp.]